jgi:hypothetical protein
MTLTAALWLTLPVKKDGSRRVSNCSRCSIGGEAFPRSMTGGRTSSMPEK